MRRCRWDGSTNRAVRWWRGCYRCLFFVPAPGTFSSPELPRLEAEAAANPGAKGALIRHLHVWLPLLRRSHCAQPLADRFATP